MGMGIGLWGGGGGGGDMLMVREVGEMVLLTTHKLLFLCCWCVLSGVQVFQRIECASQVEEFDQRFQYFLEKVL